jgi:transcription elongation factor
MQKQDEMYTSHKIGDKVQIRVGAQKGQKGIIHMISDGQLEVQLNSGGNAIILEDSITNFSLAAQKAWKTM